MQTIDELLVDVPAFAGLADSQLELIAGCAVNRVYEDGEYLEREGHAANSFYAIREGSVVLEVFNPRGGAILIETIHEPDVVGWSWLFPPYRTAFDIRSVGTTKAITFDGACLRGKLETDRELGYELMKRFARVMVDRLQATRLRLLDVYGHADSG